MDRERSCNRTCNCHYWLVLVVELEGTEEARQEGAADCSIMPFKINTTYYYLIDMTATMYVN